MIDKTSKYFGQTKKIMIHNPNHNPHCSANNDRSNCKRFWVKTCKTLCGPPSKVARLKVSYSRYELEKCCLCEHCSHLFESLSHIFAITLVVQQKVSQIVNMSPSWVRGRRFDIFCVCFSRRKSLWWMEYILWCCIATLSAPVREGRR